jgi:hypothetical protein
MLQRIRGAGTPTLIAAGVAMVLAASGGAAATTQITGVRDNSVTGDDIKNRSLTPDDFREPIRGRRGAPGPPGLNGAAGLLGSPGAPGEAGPEGEAGPRGETGVAGAPGAAGPQGETGVQGEAGTPGPEGAQGPAGPAGPQGPKGDPGTPGLQGEAGPPGTPGLANVESDGPSPGTTDLSTLPEQGANSTAKWVGDAGATLQRSWVQCAPGKTAIGGGYSRGEETPATLKNLQVLTSSPAQIKDGELVTEPIEGDAAQSIRPNGWLVEGFNNGDTELVVRPWVICAEVEE